MKINTYKHISSTGVIRGTFTATHILQVDEVVGVFSENELIGVVRLAEGECIGRTEEGK